MRSLLTLLACIALLMTAMPSSADAQSRRRRPAKTKKSRGPAKPAQAAKEEAPQKVKVFDFSGLDVAGQMRTPQLLYFLDRASEELERASLRRRSFIPEMVRSVEEEAL